MSTIRQYLVFLTGHRIAANAPVEEVGILSKIGPATMGSLGDVVASSTIAK